jgi:hypothetical protein
MKIFAEGLRIVANSFFHPLYVSASGGGVEENTINIIPILGVIFAGLIGGIAIGVWYYFWKKSKTNTRTQIPNPYPPPGYPEQR